MTIAKQQIHNLVNELPEKIDIDDLMYRIYLLKKLESAEEDIRKTRVIPHSKVVKETSKWFK
ncbi:MAG: hypothetical protein WC947_02150 [Elusimicrobiota bacterium]